MTPECAAERAAYIAAFVEAYGWRLGFTIKWENGWWSLRDRDDQRPTRYRSGQLREMTARLLARAAE